MEKPCESIRSHRIKNGFDTSEKAAAALGITINLYEKIENGTMDEFLEFLILLANLYGTTVDCLIGRERTEKWLTLDEVVPDNLEEVDIFIVQQDTRIPDVLFWAASKTFVDDIQDEVYSEVAHGPIYWRKKPAPPRCLGGKYGS